MNEKCESYGQSGQGNLSIRKYYGEQAIRYLRCGDGGEEFSERKGTPLWNSKIAESKALQIAEQVAEGTSLKGTARVVKVDTSTVKRLTKRVGQHARDFHAERAVELDIEVVEGDERYGYVGRKGESIWEAELIDAENNFVVAHVEGKRDEALIEALYEEGVPRLKDRHSVVLMTDGFASYARLFPTYFGVAYQPPRRSLKGRPPALRYRIPRQLAHVQVIKHHQGRRLHHIEIRHAHGSSNRVQQALKRLGYGKANTSAIERFNATARLMNAHQHRRSLAFSRRPQTRLALALWNMTVYTWCRENRALRQPLFVPQGKKSMSLALPLWLSA